MKIATLHGRAVLVRDGGVLDIELASSGQFGPDVHQILDNWAHFRRWVA